MDLENKVDEMELEKPKKKKKNTGLIIAVVLVFLLVVGIIVLLIGTMNFLNTQLDKITREEINRNELNINEGVREDLEGYRNILLLGIDARDMNSDENTRSDAMIIVSIDKETREIRMVSIYRDTYLDLGERVGLDKLTHAYFYGGAQQTVASINRNMDLNIEEFIVVNWKAVADAVDALGGVEIDVQESELNELNKYINETARTTGGSNEKVEKAGKQTLNGVQAVTYSRIRKDSVEGDRRRNERMKILIKAAFDKMKTMGVTELDDMTNLVLPQIKTNMTNVEMLELLLDFPAYNMGDNTSWPYDWMDFTYHGVWYGPPVTLNSNVTQLHEEYFGQKNYEPTETVQNISYEISARTGRW